MSQTLVPIRFRKLPTKQYVITNDAGDFLFGSEALIDRYVAHQISEEDRHILAKSGFTYSRLGDLPSIGFANRWLKRSYVSNQLGYVVIVPTLRCDLDCSYCQVSRVAENASGFDWSAQTLEAVKAFLGSLETKDIKIEFQGGEPLLRLDILQEIRSFCRTNFDTSEFVVCTNLQNVSDEAWAFFQTDDTQISTSFDGSFDNHKKQRTRDNATTGLFMKNLEKAIALCGEERVSVLPTLDVQNLPSVNDLISNFAQLGMRSIFLRPINHHGFARKKHDATGSIDPWTMYHKAFIKKLIEYNWQHKDWIEDFYFSHLLRRVFLGTANGHVDIRNPNILGSDYLLIDYDGQFYPTDEARMLTRIGNINLAVGNVKDGMDFELLSRLNELSLNDNAPDCVHCAYKPYCGIDLIDDLSRYGRVDVPKVDTDYCRKHMNLFDFLFELILDTDEKTQHSISLWLGVPNFSPELVRECL
ncbi:His-Xaa-Ser system radical SAM maturase HxsB [Pseudovibrio sp. POLY-S9]|uniref:His-Xaa-Ser system radical SAM maturase HxsB n=1 Tax=Pseudovibrio sp. POLY-S9 TaxID=1576596 RepID=UPI00070B9E9E|nr:His-Xaa-Ser system radical SAM maturase HxsB [Pseudovibrio sp. POLY-S9]